jgi:outer membrane receptor for ferrienterochelin and colicin
MRILFFSCAFLWCLASGHAQILTVRTTALSSSAPIEGITVYLKGENRLDSTKTNSIGNAIFFSGIQPDEPVRVYVIESTAYQFVSSPELFIRSDRTYHLHVPSRMQASLGEVLISSKPMAEMNSLNATVSGQIKKAELQSMPIEGRDISRALIRLPNVTVAVLGYTEGPNISINGLNGIFTNYLIDGMDNNERFLGNVKFNTPIGFVENVTVLTNNYSAEWGNTSNGLVNVLSNSGSNEVQGEVFYLSRPGAIVDAPSAFATRDLSGNPVKDGFQRHQTGFSLGAPIKKDKTFFYINAEQTVDLKDNLLNAPELDVNETVQGTNAFTYLSGKVDHYWSKKWRSSLRTQYGRMFIDRQGGGLEGGVNFPSAASAQNNSTYLVAFKNQVNINSKLSTELNYQHSYFRWNYREPVNAESPSVILRNPEGRTIAILGQSGPIFDSQEYTHQVQNKWYLQKDKHYFKAGIEFITSDFSLLGGGNPNGSYIVDLNPAQLEEIRQSGSGADLNVQDVPTDVSVFDYEVELRPTTFGTRQNVLSAYIEDNWTVNDRLTAAIGLRWDYDNLSKSGGDQGDFNNIAPRLSLNYKLNERSVLRGGYGIFYDKIKYAVYSDALQFSNNSPDFLRQLEELQNLGLLDPGADLNQITFEGNLRANLPNVAFLEGPRADEISDARNDIFGNNVRILNPNGWQNPYSHQFSLGYQHKPDEETLFLFDFVHTRTENLYVIRNLNVASPYLFPEGIDADDVVARTRADADASRPVPVYSETTGIFGLVGNDTLRGAARNVFMTETAGKARYTALNFMLQREISEGKIGFRLLYTLSWTKSNTSSINTRAQDNNDFEPEFAWDENDRRHVLSAVTIYRPFKRLTITPLALIQSGQPITRVADARLFGTGDLNGDGESFGLPADRWPGAEKNDDRLPWAVTFDLSVKYYLQLKRSNQKIEFTADVFNIFNAQNWSGFNTTRNISNQTQVGPPDANTFRLLSASPPRQFQFGARYIF